MRGKKEGKTEKGKIKYSKKPPRVKEDGKINPGVSWERTRPPGAPGCRRTPSGKHSCSPHPSPTGRCHFQTVPLSSNIQRGNSGTCPRLSRSPDGPAHHSSHQLRRAGRSGPSGPGPGPPHHSEARPQGLLRGRQEGHRGHLDPSEYSFPCCTSSFTVQWPVRKVSQSRPT